MTIAAKELSVPFSRENRHLTLSLSLIVAALFVVGIGIQAKVAQEDNEQRDAADRAYAECLTTFAADLVASLRARARANVKLEEAAERKDKALDRLIEISAEAQASDAETPEELPPGLLERYERVLNQRVEAQRTYERLKVKADATRDENPLVPPEVSCTR